MTRPLAICLLLLCSLGTPAAAQTLRVEDARLDLASLDTVAQTVALEVDVAWNAWRDGTRGDAAWLVGKVERSPGVWGDLRFTLDGHTAAGDVVVEAVPVPAGYASGLLVRRVRDGAGPVRATVRAVWDLGASYLDLPASGLPVRVWGVEMVRVAAGAFEVGDGAVAERQPNSFRAGEGGRYRVASEAEIDVGDTAGALFYDVPEGEAYAGGDQNGPVPEAFPKGHDAFYVMTYPITQGQYAAFLSHLPPRARAARDVTVSPGYAEKSGSIVCADGACEAAYPDRAANYLAWTDGAAWAAWAGLRPMTELEYEKAADGTPADSARYADGALPDRVGASTRRSRWGAVDLRGGLWERVVSVGTDEGRAYRGFPGLGILDDLGVPYAFANPDWPGPQALGTGYRGGTEGLLGLGEVADRTYGAYEATYGNEGQGFRAVLDAP